MPGTTLAMEGLALTGAWVDREKGLLSMIVLEMGGSADLCAYLQPGEPVVLMGPTGTPTEIPRGETVLLAGGGLGNAVLFSIGQALRAAGCQGDLLRRLQADRTTATSIDEIEAAADVVDLVLRRGARIHAAPAAGPRVRRQHRAGDARLRERASSARRRSRSPRPTASSPSAPTA